MPSSPSSSAQAARQRLGTRLRQMRTEAGITGVEFARRAGWRGSAQVSMLEKGHRTITADHVRLWCRICAVSADHEAALLAEQASVARMWISYREDVHKAGLNPTQKMGTGDLFDRLNTYRSYQTKLPHGLLQTEAFMTNVLRGVREERRLLVDDVAEAVAERMARQRLLHSRGRFTFVIEEAALRYRMFTPDVHREQLLHLLDVGRLPSVSFGVIPQDADRAGYRLRESFEIVNDDTATIELLSGFLRLDHPEEVAMYREAWSRLSALAVHGDRARALVTAALEALGDGRGEP